MLKIGEFSKLAQVSPKALRLYDERGLLRPAWTDRFTGYRYYAPEQLARLHRILALKDLGFSLEQIGDLLDGELDAEALGRMMREQQQELSRHITAEQARLARIEARLQQMEQSPALPRYEVVMKQVRPMTVAGLHQKLLSPAELPHLLDSFQRTLRLPAAVPVLGIYYDEVFQDGDLEIEMAVPLLNAAGRSGTMRVHELPGAELMACTVHRGPYSALPKAYEAVLTWLDRSGYRVDGPNRDLFLEGQAPGEAGEQAVTEVQFPIRPKAFMSTVAKLKDKKEMEIKIVTRPAFTVVGLPYYGKNENEEIPEMWGVFNQRSGEIKNIADAAYGLCKEAGADGRFHYLAGLGVSRVEDVPEGMEAWAVPEEMYAVFPCELPTIHETYQYAFETWLPASEYQYNHGIDFELYDEEFDDEGRLFIYIPVEKK